MQGPYSSHQATNIAHGESRGTNSTEALEVQVANHIINETRLQQDYSGSIRPFPIRSRQDQGKYQETVPFPAPPWRIAKQNLPLHCPRLEFAHGNAVVLPANSCGISRICLEGLSFEFHEDLARQGRQCDKVISFIIWACVKINLLARKNDIPTRAAFDLRIIFPLQLSNGLLSGHSNASKFDKMINPRDLRLRVFQYEISTAFSSCGLSDYLSCYLSREADGRLGHGFILQTHESFQKEEEKRNLYHTISDGSEDDYDSLEEES